MTDKKIWLVTGADRGMGTDIAGADLDAGHAVVATGRNADRVTGALGAHQDLLAVDAAVQRFGRIDVLVNNAANFYAGFFEEIPPEDFRNVTRAVLPVMRAQRSGLVVTVSSVAGITGDAFTSAYVASKCALEGWSESLTPEVAPFGIRTMLVEPGFSAPSSRGLPPGTPEPSIEDYAERTRQTVTAWRGMHGQQGGDPAKLARALVQLTDSGEPPLRWAAGADAVAAFEAKAQRLLDQADAHRGLSSSLAHEDVPASA